MSLVFFTGFVLAAGVYPLRDSWLPAILLAYGALLWWRPALWLLVLPALLPALDLAQPGAQRHAQQDDDGQRIGQVQAARKRRQSRIQGQRQQGQRRHLAHERLPAQQPGGQQGKAERQITVQRGAPGMHGGEGRGDAVVAGEIEQAGKQHALTDRRATDQQQAGQHARHQ